MDDDRLRALLVDLHREGSQDPSPMPQVRPVRRRTAGRMAVALVAAAAVVVAALLVTTRGTDEGSVQQLTPAPATGSEPVSFRQDPLRLVGLWRVSETPADARTDAGERRVVTLRLGADLIAFTPCGEIFGSWLADAGGGFVAGVSGDSGTCPGLNAADYSGAGLIPWLTRTTSYTTERDGVRLYDAGGRLTARLTPGGVVGARDGLDPSLTEPPVVDSALRERLRPARTPAAPSGDLRVADVAGRWIPFPSDGVRRPQQPYLQLSSDDTWSGSDGCNGEAGQWRLMPGGEVTATSGPMTAIGCSNAATSLGNVRSMRLVDGQLRLYDVDARLIGSFTRG